MESDQKLEQGTPFFKFNNGETLIEFIVERFKRLGNVLDFIVSYLVFKTGELIARSYIAVFKAKNAVLRFKIRTQWYLGRKIMGYKFISAEDFLKEFPPTDRCNKCHGAGFSVVLFANGIKRINLCKCSIDQYKKSGKKYELLNKV